MVSRVQLRTDSFLLPPVQYISKLPVRISMTALLHSRRLDISLGRILRKTIADLSFHKSCDFIQTLLQSKTGVNFKQYDFLFSVCHLEALLFDNYIFAYNSTTSALKYVPVVLGHHIRTLRSRLDIFYLHARLLFCQTRSLLCA